MFGYGTTHSSRVLSRRHVSGVSNSQAFRISHMQVPTSYLQKNRIYAKTNNFDSYTIAQINKNMRRDAKEGSELKMRYADAGWGGKKWDSKTSADVPPKYTMFEKSSYKLSIYGVVRRRMKSGAVSSARIAGFRGIHWHEIIYIQKKWCYWYPVRLAACAFHPLHTLQFNPAWFCIGPFPWRVAKCWMMLPKNGVKGG